MDPDLMPPNDDIFTTSVRLTIMILLCNHKKAVFMDLQKLLQITPGNLDHHIRKLEEAKYVKTYKQIFPRRPLTIVEITELGKNSIREYIKSFQNVMNKIEL